jgi:hypothetical protein
MKIAQVLGRNVKWGQVEARTSVILQFYTLVDLKD